MTEKSETPDKDEARVTVRIDRDVWMRLKLVSLVTGRYTSDLATEMIRSGMEQYDPQVNEYLTGARVLGAGGSTP